LGEDLLGLFGPQTADAVGRRGVGYKSRFERFVLRRGQFAGPPRLPLGTEGLQAVIAIPVDPTLHEPPTALQDSSDLGGLVAFQGQNYGAVAVSLLGVTLRAAVLTELLKVLRMMERDLHRTIPPVSSRVCQMPGMGATLF
jgi:hypothetical protein